MSTEYTQVANQVSSENVSEMIQSSLDPARPSSGDPGGQQGVLMAKDKRRNEGGGHRSPFHVKRKQS